MANTMRWRYGDTNPVMLPVLTATVIEIGDLVYLDTNNAKPASEIPDLGSLTQNQQAFKSAFVGVAMQASAADDNRPIRIATSGVFEFDCDAAQFELGDLVGNSENSAGDALEDQRVVAASSVTEALGRCAKRVEPAGNRVLIDIVSTIMRGGSQAAA